MPPVAPSKNENRVIFRVESNNHELIHLGVERKRAFNGHISLLYIEENLTDDDRRALADLLIAINDQFFQTPLPYNIAQAEVRKFNNFLSYYRQDDWPIYVL